MKKIYFSTLLLLLIVSSIKSQDITSIFPTMPREIVHGLTIGMKQELVENPSDTSLFVSTMIYERVKRLEINSEFISLKTSAAGSTQVRLLPLINDSKIICVVQTVESGIADSKISFYTDRWEPIDAASLFPELDVQWFIKTDVDRNSQDYKNAMIALSMMNPMKLSLSPDEESITVTYNPKSFLSTDDYKLVEQFLTKEPKILHWDKTSFK